MTWHTAVAVISSADRPAWLEARKSRLTSTEIAKAMTPGGWRVVVSEKLHGLERPDNEYFEHGRLREGDIADAARVRHGVEPSRYLFDGVGASATPDGVHPDRPELGEYKTGTNPMPKTTPRMYRDQIYVAQYVFGAERTLLGWEHHKNGVPVGLEPEWRWVERDEERITQLLEKAAELADYLKSEGLTLAY